MHSPQSGRGYLAGQTGELVGSNDFIRPLKEVVLPAGSKAGA